MNFDSDFLIVRYSLQFVGLWPFDRTPYDEIKFIISLVSNIISAMVNIMQAFNTGGDISFIRNLWYIFTFITTAIFMCLMKKYETATKTILNWMKENLENYNHLSLECQIAMSVQRTQTKKIITIFYGMIVLCVVSTIFDPLIVAYVTNEPIVSVIDKGWHSFSVQTSPGLEIMFVIRALAMMNCAIALSGIDIYIIFMIFHICGQINILCINIKTYKEYVNHSEMIAYGKESNCNNCLRCLVNHHNSIARISTVAEECVTYIIFTKFFFNGFEICFIGFLIMTEIRAIFKIMMDIIYFILVASSCLMFGWLGEKLTEHGYKIGDIVYSSDWYELNQVKTRRALSVIICRAQMPMKISAGKFITMSLKTIGQLFLTWLSYIFFLKAVKSSQE